MTKAVGPILTIMSRWRKEQVIPHGGSKDKSRAENKTNILFINRINFELTPTTK